MKVPEVFGLEDDKGVIQIPEKISKKIFFEVYNSFKNREKWASPLSDLPIIPDVFEDGHLDDLIVTVVTLWRQSRKKFNDVKAEHVQVL
jgi:hypothetical protein